VSEWRVHALKQGSELGRGRGAPALPGAQQEKQGNNGDDEEDDAADHTACYGAGGSFVGY